MTSPTPIDFSRFKNLTYADFRRMANDPTLSLNERIGFPDSYREGQGEAIFADICAKLRPLDQDGGLVIDIGPGCADLPRLMIEHTRAHQQHLVLIDAPEMLDLLPDGDGIEKLPGYFPDDCTPFIQSQQGRADAVLIYSVVQTLLQTGSVAHFLDSALALLKPGGALLVGDVPNVSKRKRFFASAAGVAFHKDFMQTEDAPEVTFNTQEFGQFDDGLIVGLIMRARAAGFDAYWLPQPPHLPMANRRDDLLFLLP